MKIITIVLCILIICSLILIYNFIVYKYKTYVLHKNENENVIVNKNLKIALCISGQLRNFRECYPFLKKYLLDIYNPDIFAYIDDQNNAQELDFFNKNMKPKKIIVSHKQSNNKFHFDKNASIMFERIYKCNKLKKEYEYENNFKYDIVVRLRPDLYIDSIIPLYNYDEKSLFIPNTISLIFTFMLVNDQFAYGSSNIMDMYSNFYNEYITTSKCGVPEIHLKKYIKNKKINIINFDTLIYPMFYNKPFNSNNFMKMLNKYKLWHIDCFC